MSELKCASCGKGFVAPPAAPHKRFCSEKCRNEWHRQERAQAVEELRVRSSSGRRENLE